MQKALADINGLPLDYFKNLQCIKLQKIINQIQSLSNNNGDVLKAVNLIVKHKYLFWKTTSDLQSRICKILIKEHNSGRLCLKEQCRKLFRRGVVQLPYDAWSPDFHWLLRDEDQQRIFTWLLVAKRIGLDQHLTLYVSKLIYAFSSQ